MSGSSKRTPEQLCKAIEQQAAADEAERVAAMSGPQVDDQLRARGFDPADVRAKGEAIAREMFARRQAEARAVDVLARERARLAAVRSRRGKLARAELLARIEAARSDPRLPAPLVVGFRNRGGESASDEELEALLDELDALLEGGGGSEGRG